MIEPYRRKQLGRWHKIVYFLVGAQVLFIYIFPIYQKNYKTIWYHWKSKKRGWQGRRIYHYAHNDWLQFLAEYGILGCFFLSGMFLCLVIPAIRLCAFAKLEGFLILRYFSNFYSQFCRLYF